MLKIGQISYLNCIPIFSALKELYPDGDYEYVQGVPSNLNQQLRDGAIGISPSSSIEYALHPDLYCFIPDISISAVGEVKSVMLFSNQPIAALDGAEIGLTSDSATSVILLKIILNKYLKFQNTFTVTNKSVAEGLKEFSALLLIGDHALSESLADHSGCFVYDMGSLWHQYTGLPFVFALWLVREDIYRKSGDEVAAFKGRLLAAKYKSLESFDKIAEICKVNTGLSRNVLMNYWRTISYDLTSEHIAGLRLFFKSAYECSLIDAEPPLKVVV